MTILKYYNLSWLTAALPWHTTQHSWQVGNRIVRMRQSWHSCLTNMTWQPWHDRTQSHEQLKITSWLQWLTWHGNMITMSWPRDNHARTMWQPCQDQVTTLSWQCDNHVSVMWQPWQCNVTTMTLQWFNHDSAMWQPWQCNVTTMTVQWDSQIKAICYTSILFNLWLSKPELIFFPVCHFLYCHTL